MEHIDDTDLCDHIGTTEFADAKIRSYLKQLCVAAQFLQDRAVCHRDIKPANVRARSASGELVLLDLGVIRLLDGNSHLTEENGARFTGTLRYAPPEFLFNKAKQTPAGWEAITVYQLGTVLYELIHSAKLFANISDHRYPDLVKAVEEVSPPVQRADVGQDLVTITRCSLFKDPATRLGLADLARVATAVHAPPTNGPDLSRYLGDIEARSDALEATKRNVAAQARRLDGIGQQVGAVVARALHLEGVPELKRFSLNPTVVDTRGVERSGFNYARVCEIPENLKSGIIGRLRLLITWAVNDSGTVFVRGIAFRGTDFTLEAGQTGELIERNDHLRKLREEIWNEPLDSAALVIALNMWIRTIFGQYFEATSEIHRRRTDLERQIAAQTIAMWSLEPVPFEAFTTLSAEAFREPR